MTVTQENGKRVKLVGREDISHQEALFIVETGRMINRKAKARKKCQMVPFMKEIIILGPRMGKVCTSFPMALIIMEILKIIYLMAMDSFLGLMERNTLVTGLKTKCMVKVNLHGQMDVYTLVNIIMMSNRAKESSFGQILKIRNCSEFMKECGLELSNMELAFTLIKKESK